MTAPPAPDLGTTDVADELVPGKPSAMHSLASRLKDLSTKVDGSGDTLKALRVESWTGQAADSFRDAFSAVPTMWFKASDALNDCATALEDYAYALESAQSRAQDAIDLWNKAKGLKAESDARYAAEVAEYERLAADGIYSEYPFPTNNGDAERIDAQGILRSARDDLHDAGEDALMGLVRATGGEVTSGSMQGPGADANASWGTDSLTVGSSGSEWSDGEWGTKAAGFVAMLGSASASAWVWKAQGSFSKPVGGMGGQIYGNGEISALAAHADASISVTSRGLKGSASAGADLVSAAGAVGYSTDYSTVELAGSASVGAEAEVSVAFAPDEVKASASAFAGGKAEADTTMTVGGVGVDVGGDVRYGIGAEAEAGYEYEDGKLTIGVDAGLAVAVGFGVDAAIVVDVDEMGRTVTDMWDEVSSWW